MSPRATGYPSGIPCFSRLLASPGDVHVLAILLYCLKSRALSATALHSFQWTCVPILINDSTAICVFQPTSNMLLRQSELVAI